MDAATARLHRYCLETLRADLVGVANIERCRHAPARMSPQGILPSARSVIVMAVHHPDACIEQGGRQHPQEIGPYRVQYRMNQRLDEMSFRLANHLQSLGYPSVPIFSSNSWRYRGYKDLSEQFAADVSHMHMACAAGLAEFGYNGLAITPEFGARNRFVTVITEGIFNSSPLVEPGSVCDSCMLCRKHCRSGALSKELDGWNEVLIPDPAGDKTYRYVRKNLWRCSWGEHFDLDLDLPIPDKVTPEVINEALALHGQRGGEMGSCLRHCLPHARRYFQKEITDAPRRRLSVTPAATGPDRDLFSHLAALSEARGADALVVQALSGSTWNAFLPGAVRSVTVVLRRPHASMPSADETQTRILAQACYDMVRCLEQAGYEAICETDHDEALLRSPLGADVVTQSVLTTCPLPVTPTVVPVTKVKTPLTLTKLLAEAGQTCEQLFGGVADAQALDAVAKQLAPHWSDQVELVVVDKGGWENRFGPMQPEVTQRPVEIHGPSNVLPGARRVVVLALPLPREAVACHGRAPAEAPGPNAQVNYESRVLLRLAAWRVVKMLEAAGYTALVSDDLVGTGSLTGNPRGPQPDAFCNRFAAVAAGLAHLGLSGQPIHPEHGGNFRTISVVTDAPLAVSPLLSDEARPRCAGCTRCQDACLVNAPRPAITVSVASQPQTFHPINRSRCDWAKRFSLVAEEGTALLGWKLDLRPSTTVTPEELTQALKQLPGIERHRPCNAERCLLACPYTR